MNRTRKEWQGEGVLIFVIVRSRDNMKTLPYSHINSSFEQRKEGLIREWWTIAGNVHLIKALFKVLDSVAPLVVVDDSTTYTDKHLSCHIGKKMACKKSLVNLIFLLY